MAFSTILGIASIAPFFSVLGDPQLIDHSRFFHRLYVALAFTDKRSFEVALGLMFMTVVISANSINALCSFAMIRMAWRISTELQATLFREYLARPYVFHATHHSAALYNNIVYETSRVTNSMLQNVFALVTNAVTAGCIVFAVMLLNPAVGASMVLILAGGYIAIYLTVRKRLMQAGHVQSHFFTEQTKIVSEGLGAIKEVLVLRIQDFFRRRFEESSQAFARAAAHTQLVRQSPRYIMECVAVAGLIFVALFAGGHENGVGPWLGHLTFIGFAAYRLLPTMQQSFTALVAIRNDRAGFAKVAPDLRLARARSFFRALPDAHWQERPQQEVRLHNVSFRYGPDHPPAVDGVSMRMPTHAAVAVMGMNGSGKTSLIDILAGLLSPTSGHVEVDGIIIGDENREDWQSRIAYVPQVVFLTDATIAQNIAFGVADEAIDRNKLAAAARLAQLEQFIGTLPLGYSHRVGERGTQLSGGQRQKIGIARALYAEASVLILDEATSALDGMTEHELIATILKLRERYTVILIAHRLATVRGCDLIFEFDRGRIVGHGSYAEMLRKSETLRRLAEVG